MTDNAIIAGQLVDVRNIGHDKSIKLTVHVPAEMAERVIEAFGWPTNVAPVSVAVAKLVEPAEQSEKAVTHEPAARTDLPIQPGGTWAKSWRDLSSAQQAGILCSEKSFWHFLQQWPNVGNDGVGVIDEEWAASVVRRWCHVPSRANILPNTWAEEQWNALVSEFRAWEAAPRAGL